MNEYFKLKFYEIKIYAKFDVYFRYLFWIYVDINVRTKISVYRQYLNTIKNINIMFFIIRSNRDSEVFLITQIHLKLRCEKKITYKYNVKNTNKHFQKILLLQY